MFRAKARSKARFGIGSRCISELHRGPRVLEPHKRGMIGHRAHLAQHASSIHQVGGEGEKIERCKKKDGSTVGQQRVSIFQSNGSFLIIAHE